VVTTTLAWSGIRLRNAPPAWLTDAGSARGEPAGAGRG
jgi:hypothetical protein